MWGRCLSGSATTMSPGSAIRTTQETSISRETRRHQLKIGKFYQCNTAVPRRDPVPGRNGFAKGYGLGSGLDHGTVFSERDWARCWDEAKAVFTIVANSIELCT